MCSSDAGGLWKFFNEFLYWKNSQLKQVGEGGDQGVESLKESARVDRREVKSSCFGACLPEFQSWLSHSLAV